MDQSPSRPAVPEQTDDVVESIEQDDPGPTSGRNLPTHWRDGEAPWSPIRRRDGRSLPTRGERSELQAVARPPQRRRRVNIVDTARSQGSYGVASIPPYRRRSAQTNTPISPGTRVLPRAHPAPPPRRQGNPFGYRTPSVLRSPLERRGTRNHPIVLPATPPNTRPSPDHDPFTSAELREMSAEHRARFAHIGGDTDSEASTIILERSTSPAYGSPLDPNPPPGSPRYSPSPALPPRNPRTPIRPARPHVPRGAPYPRFDDGKSNERPRVRLPPVQEQGRGLPVAGRPYVRPTVETEDEDSPETNGLLARNPEDNIVRVSDRFRQAPRGSLGPRSVRNTEGRHEPPSTGPRIRPSPSHSVNALRERMSRLRGNVPEPRDVFQPRPVERPHQTSPPRRSPPRQTPPRRSPPGLTPPRHTPPRRSPPRTRFGQYDYHVRRTDVPDVNQTFARQYLGGGLQQVVANALHLTTDRAPPFRDKTEAPLAAPLAAIPSGDPNRTPPLPLPDYESSEEEDPPAPTPPCPTCGLEIPDRHPPPRERANWVCLTCYQDHEIAPVGAPQPQPTGHCDLCERECDVCAARRLRHEQRLAQQHGEGRGQGEGDGLGGGAGAYGSPNSQATIDDPTLYNGAAAGSGQTAGAVAIAGERSPLGEGEIPEEDPPQQPNEGGQGSSGGQDAGQGGSPGSGGGSNPPDSSGGHSTSQPSTSTGSSGSSGKSSSNPGSPQNPAGPGQPNDHMESPPPFPRLTVTRDIHGEVTIGMPGMYAPNAVYNGVYGAPPYHGQFLPAAPAYGGNANNGNNGGIGLGIQHGGQAGDRQLYNANGSYAGVIHALQPPANYAPVYVQQQQQEVQAGPAPTPSPVVDQGTQTDESSPGTSTGSSGTQTNSPEETPGVEDPAPSPESNTTRPAESPENDPPSPGPDPLIGSDYESAEDSDYIDEPQSDIPEDYETDSSAGSDSYTSSEDEGPPGFEGYIYHALSSSESESETDGPEPPSRTPTPTPEPPSRTPTPPPGPDSPPYAPSSSTDDGEGVVSPRRFSTASAGHGRGRGRGRGAARGRGATRGGGVGRGRGNGRGRATGRARGVVRGRATAASGRRAGLRSG
ncbi:hypothetical protein LTR95_003243 [Oleoguttula sp. CCFEE 5521]